MKKILLIAMLLTLTTGMAIAQSQPGSGQGAGFAIGGAIFFGNNSLTGSAQSSLDVADSTFSGNQAIGG